MRKGQCHAISFYSFIYCIICPSFMDHLLSNILLYGILPWLLLMWISMQLLFEIISREMGECFKILSCQLILRYHTNLILGMWTLVGWFVIHMLVFIFHLFDISFICLILNHPALLFNHILCIMCWVSSVIFHVFLCIFPQKVSQPS